MGFAKQILCFLRIYRLCGGLHTQRKKFLTQDFTGFGLPAKLLQAIARLGFAKPTPIQAQTLPLALSGRDILGSAQTGTGKTAAFGIPIIVGLMDNPGSMALVLTPTRELASQVLKAMMEMVPVPGIRGALLIGGETMPRQLRQLDMRPRIIVGTPGRINDHLERRSLRLDSVRYLVLDETDRMLDMGFGVQIERIMKHVPDDRQTMMFSATIPDDIAKLSGKYLRNAERVAVGSTTSPLAKIQQELIHTDDAGKFPHLLDQLTQRQGSVLVFVKTKYGTEKLAKKLVKEGHAADAIHGDLQQNRRTRVIDAFRDQKYRVLVATDIAARGLDIPHIEHVINYDLPQCPEDYIHRIGRTARAGAEGAAINLLTPADAEKWRAIHKLIHGVPAKLPEGYGVAAKGKGKKSRGKKPQGRPSQDKAPQGQVQHGKAPQGKAAQGDAGSGGFDPLKRPSPDRRNKPFGGGGKHVAGARPGGHGARPGHAGKKQGRGRG
ncbi:MAG TPA: ATP-dependent RNA helicase [Rhodospirillaceae bacterium]|nr:ATP-dependent RNA helicase [Rhodospirillaceae bacterium]